MNVVITDEQRKHIIQTLGVKHLCDMMGGPINVLKYLYQNDISKYFEETGFKPFDIIKGDKINMYIDDFVVQLLDLEDKGFSGRDEKMLGNFVYQPQKNGIKYKFTGYLNPSTRASGQKLWRVVGMSGSSGFGYSFINQRDVLGNRSRNQIFNQIIDKYNLEKFLR